MSLGGVAIYIDDQKPKAVRSMLLFGKSIKNTPCEDEKSSKNLSAISKFSKRCPFKKPSNPELKGWDGIWANLGLCIGVGIKRDANNDSLLCPDDVFVWSERTLAKLGGGGGELRAKQLRFAL